MQMKVLSWTLQKIIIHRSGGDCRKLRHFSFKGQVSAQLQLFVTISVHFKKSRNFHFMWNLCIYKYQFKILPGECERTHLQAKYRPWYPMAIHALNFHWLSGTTNDLADYEPKESDLFVVASQESPRESFVFFQFSDMPDFLNFT